MLKKIAIISILAFSPLAVAEKTLNLSDLRQCVSMSNDMKEIKQRFDLVVSHIDDYKDHLKGTERDLKDAKTALSFIESSAKTCETDSCLRGHQTKYDAQYSVYETMFESHNDTVDEFNELVEEQDQLIAKHDKIGVKYNGLCADAVFTEQDFKTACWTQHGTNEFCNGVRQN